VGNFLACHARCPSPQGLCILLLTRRVVRRITRENVRPEERAEDLEGGQRRRPRKTLTSEIHRRLTRKTRAGTVNDALEESKISVFPGFP